MGRYQSRLKRALFGVTAFVLGFVVYFVPGLLFIIVRPEVARETGLAIGHGFKTLTVMLAVVTAATVAFRSRSQSHDATSTRGREI